MPRYRYEPSPNVGHGAPAIGRGQTGLLRPGEVYEVTDEWAAELNRRIAGLGGRPAMVKIVVDGRPIKRARVKD